MNEIILTGNTTLGTTPLGRKTAAIIKLANNQIRDEKQIAIRVAEVDRDELATTAGFKNTAEWAGEFLDFSKSKVSRYVSIVNRFKFVKVTDEQGRDYWDIFTLSQLQEMLKATDAQLQQITPDMTVKAIREYLSYIDIQNAPETEGTTPNETETGDGNETETEDATPDTTTPPVKEFDDITVALSYIRQFALANDGSPVMFARVGDKFRVVCDTSVKTI